MDISDKPWLPETLTAGSFRPPEIPRDPMEFLFRSWSVSTLEVSKALPGRGGAIPEDASGETETAASVAGSPFCFASSATSQLVMERIMSQSELFPLISGRLSHSSGPSNGGQSCESLSDSPPVSPSVIDDIKYCSRVNNTVNPQYKGSSKTVGRWLKDRREKKKEVARAHNAQIHAAASVAGVAAAVAAIAAAATLVSGSTNDMAVASAATFVAAQCVESAESIGAERDHLASVVSSAVNVKTPGDIITLTAAAATALRGAATLKARAMKEVWNMAAVIPVEKGSTRNHRKQRKHSNDNCGGCDGEFIVDENFLLCGTELLKRTRKGALHWKLVSVYINRVGQVMLKMKSRHVAGTITKKKKCVVSTVCRDIPAWPGRQHLLNGEEQQRYFGLRTAGCRVIEFECSSRREYEMWTQGVSQLLRIVSEKKHLT